MTDQVFPHDILYGAREIATFLFGSGESRFARRVYYLKETVQLPHFHMNRQRFCARRSTLAAWITDQEADRRGR